MRLVGAKPKKFWAPGLIMPGGSSPGSNAFSLVTPGSWSGNGAWNVTSGSGVTLTCLNVPIGPATANRMLAFVISANSDANWDGMTGTIGGQPLTFYYNTAANRKNGGQACILATAFVPTGTVADLSLTCPANQFFGQAFAVYLLPDYTKLASTTPTLAVAKPADGVNAGLSFTVPDGSFIIGLAAGSGSLGGTSSVNSPYQKTSFGANNIVSFYGPVGAGVTTASPQVTWNTTATNILVQAMAFK